MNDQVLYLIYDGECAMCKNVAKLLKIRQTVGKFTILNAREKHPLIEEVKSKGHNLNDGIIVQYQGQLYFGKDAVQLLAMLGDPVDLFNKINTIIFKPKFLSSILYPVFKTVRSGLLLLLGIQEIKEDANEPIFKNIFGSSWVSLPHPLKKHYANRAYSNDEVKAKGQMDIEFSKLFKLLSRLLKVFGALVPYEGKNIPVTVYSRSEMNSNHYILERHFRFPHQKPFIFRSRLVHVKNNEAIELMKYNIGWRCYYKYDGLKITLTHKGYAWRIFGIYLPLPLSLILGKCQAELEAMDGNSFRMQMVITHFLFGQTFAYGGTFKII